MDMDMVVVVVVGFGIAAVIIALVFRIVRSSGKASSTSRLLDTADEAGRLARAIASDVALYNAEAVAEARRSGARPAALVAALDEGRSLFQARVTPRLHRCYDEAVDDIVLARRT